MPLPYVSHVIAIILLCISGLEQGLVDRADLYVRYNLTDLHTHSFCSDGLRTPAQAVEEAHKARLQALSLTDHDTVEGVDEAMKAGKEWNLEVIPGTELSAHVKVREVHILAYCLEWKNPELLEHLDLLRTERQQRGVAIVELLNNLGVELTLEEVLQVASGGSLGRPHIAAALVSRGVVTSKDEAFERYLGDRSPAFSPKPYHSAADVIDLVHRVGGVAILAHPGTSLPETIILQLINVGLDGLEVFHPAHQAPLIEYYTQLTVQHNLLQSGGSDSHGGPEGVRIGDYGIGYEAIDAMRQRAASYA